ncbi:bifunctional riboflavin kinase/FAD synthetase [Clostridium tarantellae]|uniref:Riboflavin biosynthesis protein n=1 Tax=Clostridium tarantellae TaxID=39493 RepID=A0A6I1MQ55_9CLOT|nr:bifunctional riboflavin kinase/FAD synthetase [Clostridium tarantellae]MPQ42419.1 bifunctional riboflavin kinase/FAD synthetase [Clostridium tarantellae]
MILINDDFHKIKSKSVYVALGSFDGLHIGHLSLINKSIDLAKKNNGLSMVYTFENHPLTFINKEKAPKLLIDNKNKIKLLENLGIDIACFINFNEHVMKMNPSDFIKKLVEQYNIKGIVVGFNYRFGYKNLGDLELLKKLSEKLDFELYVMEAMLWKYEVISSTRIRQMISNGSVEEANTLLTRPFMLSGKVIHGRKIGRTIGFPTANMEIDRNMIIPKKGVYYTNLECKGKFLKGITSVGNNPTVNGDNITIETYILDFSESIYDNEVKVYFIEYIRDEIKFNSLNDLKNQLEKDKNFAKLRNIKI